MPVLPGQGGKTAANFILWGAASGEALAPSSCLALQAAQPRGLRPTSRAPGGRARPGAGGDHGCQPGGWRLTRSARPPRGGTTAPSSGPSVNAALGPAGARGKGPGFQARLPSGESPPCQAVTPAARRQTPAIRACCTPRAGPELAALKDTQGCPPLPLSQSQTHLFSSRNLLTS